MHRLHVIDEPHRMGGEVYFREDKYMHDPELREAYECGKKQGWREAMKEVEHGGYNERREWRMPPMYRDEPPMYRNDWRQPEDGEVMYRRHRAANGRYM